MSITRFTPRQLDAFIAAAELGSFTLAARRLHLTPSAISNLMTELEAILGFVLFERTTRKVVVTADGREFLPSALAVKHQLDRAGSAAIDIRNRAIDVVRIAAPMAVAATLLPSLIVRHRLDRPRTIVRIIDTGVEWLADRVAIGEADLSLGPDRVVQADIRRIDLFPSPWVIWLSPTHRLAERDAIRWRDLADTEVFAAGRDHEHSVRPQLPDDSLTATIKAAQIVENFSTALGLAAAGLGVTFSPDYVAPFAQAFGLVMRRLTEPDVIRHMSLYEPMGRKLPAAIAAFRDFLIAESAPASKR